MKTLRLQISVPDGTGRFRISLFDECAADAPLAAAWLERQQVDAARWSPAAIRAHFQQTGQASIEFANIGRQLGEWAGAGDIALRLKQERAAGNGALLLEVLAPELRDLPWELMRSGQTPDGLNSKTPIARFHRGNAKAAALEWPLRVLVVIGAAADSDIGAEEEVQGIERALHPYGHSVDREILRRPTQKRLLEMLQSFKPHVFVFIGHCEADDDQSPSQLRFQLSDPAERWNWSADALALALNNADWCPLMVMLNACRTWQVEHSFRFSDVLIEAGVPACLVMQGDVRGDLAGTFSSSVLRNLCSDMPLDVAVAKARNDISNRPDVGLDKRDWAFPVLLASQPPATLFAPRPMCDAIKALKVAPVLADVQLTADRRDARRVLRSRLLVGPSGGGLAVLVGDRRGGKTHVAKWCLEHFALLYDAHVQYVPIASGASDFLSVLRRIRDGDAATLPGLATEHFHAFNWNLNRILEGGVPGEWGGAPAQDEGRRYDATTVSYEHAVRDLLAEFVDALRSLSRKRPVVLALDQFRSSNDSFAIEQGVMRDVIVPHLLKPVLEGSLPGVLIVVVMNVDDCAYFGIDRLVPASEWIRLNADLSGSPSLLARELLWYPADEILADGLQGLFDSMAMMSKIAADAPSTPLRYIASLRQLLAGAGVGQDLQTRLGVTQMG